MNESSLTKSQSLDIYRKTCLRYLGYFGLLGKICTPIIPGNIVKTVAMSYILSDVADKSYKTAKEGEGKLKLLVNASDAIIWQAASSVLIPAFLIKSFSEHAQKLKVYRKLAAYRSGALPYVLGITLIPFLSYPIDRSVNFIMDNSYRKWFKDNSEICENAFESTEQTFSSTTNLNYEHDDFDKIYEEFKSRNTANQTRFLHAIENEPTNKPTKKQFNKISDKQSNKLSNKKSKRHVNKQPDTGKPTNKSANKEANKASPKESNNLLEKLKEL